METEIKGKKLTIDVAGYDGLAIHTVMYDGLDVVTDKLDIAFKIINHKKKVNFTSLTVCDDYGKTRCFLSCDNKIFSEQVGLDYVKTNSECLNDILMST